MIKKLIKEYMEGGFAVQTVEVAFLSIPIFKYKKITTNNEVIQLLTSTKKLNKIKGFSK